MKYSKSTYKILRIILFSQIKASKIYKKKSAYYNKYQRL